MMHSARISEAVTPHVPELLRVLDTLRRLRLPTPRHRRGSAKLPNEISVEPLVEENEALSGMRAAAVAQLVSLDFGGVYWGEL